MNLKYIRKHFLLGILTLISVGISSAYSQKHDTQPNLKLWYSEPAHDWLEALPVGNGSLGGMVFGDPSHERIQLNEESVWTGHPVDRANPEARAYLDSVRSLLFAGKYVEGEHLAQEKIMGTRLDQGKHTYQTLGNLYIDLPGSDKVTDYRRELDLNDGLIRINYKQNGVQYHREIFSSYPDQVMIMRFSADQSGQTSFQMKMNRPGPGEKVQVNNDEITMRQHTGGGDGVRYTARLHVLKNGGQITTTDSTFSIKNADDVTLLLAAATDYRKDNPDAVTQERIYKAQSQSFSQLKQRHVDDYQHLFKRVSLDLTPDSFQVMPTDQSLQRVKKGATDPHLTELYFQYGRYLLISSSRPGSLPANLQGIWAQGLKPPWNADYHININLQMNYWPSDLTNLSESAEPFFKFVESLKKCGKITARETYGSRGIVAHHTTDVWHFTDPIGQTHYGLWPMGDAWLSMRFWDHYRFTEDRDFLRDQAYPQMKEASKFFIDYLVKDPDTGYLVTGPSMSPENQFITPDGKRASVCMGPTMDMEILHELFGATIKAAKTLDIDSAYRDTLQALKKRLAPIRIGANGTIMEWNKDFKEQNPGHRHISHLYSLYPGDAINSEDTPELMTAARKTIDRRLSHGGGHTGWSRAWIINFFARLKDSEKSYENLQALYRKSTLSNLFDTHPPFQIDGNFGGTAGIAEMLLQSQAKAIELLPALPHAWSQGEVHGLRARGDFVVDMQWEDGALSSATIQAGKDRTCNLKYGNQSIQIPMGKGEIVKVNHELKVISRK